MLGEDVRNSWGDISVAMVVAGEMSPSKHFPGMATATASVGATPPAALPVFNAQLMCSRRQLQALTYLSYLLR